VHPNLPQQCVGGWCGCACENVPLCTCVCVCCVSACVVVAVAGCTIALCIRGHENPTQLCGCWLGSAGVIGVCTSTAALPAMGCLWLQSCLVRRRQGVVRCCCRQHATLRAAAAASWGATRRAHPLAGLFAAFSSGHLLVAHRPRTDLRACFPVFSSGRPLVAQRAPRRLARPLSHLLVLQRAPTRAPAFSFGHLLVPHAHAGWALQLS
jgi:hypothetical protein